MRLFFKIEANFCLLMYAFLTIVRCGTISVIPSLLAHAGIEHCPKGFLDIQRFHGIESVFDDGLSETKQFRCSFPSIFLAIFFRSNHLGVNMYSRVGFQTFCFGG